MEIYVLTIDTVFVAAFRHQTDIAAYLVVKVDAIRKQFSRKGYYSKGNIRVIRVEI